MIIYKKRVSALGIFFVLCFHLSVIFSVQGQERAFAGKFRKVEKPISSQYIVIFKDNVSANQVDSLALNLTKAKHGKLQATYKHSLKGFSIHNISEKQAIEISKDSRVEFVEENSVGRTGSTQSIDYTQL